MSLRPATAIRPIPQDPDGLHGQCLPLPHGAVCCPAPGQAGGLGGRGGAPIDPRQLCPGEHSHKLRLLLEFAPATGGLEIPDPCYGSLAGFERVLDLCEAGVRGLLAQFNTGQPQPRGS